MIAFTENSSIPMWRGIFLAVLMFIASELSSLLLNNYYYLMFRLGTRIQSVLVSAVYKKVNNCKRIERIAQVLYGRVVDC